MSSCVLIETAFCRYCCLPHPSFVPTGGLIMKPSALIKATVCSAGLLMMSSVASSATVMNPSTLSNVAAPATFSSTATAAQASASVVKVRGRHWRGRRHGGWRGGRWIGPAIGAGIAAAILSGPYYYRPRYRYYDSYEYRRPRRGAAWRACDDRFRSFRWSDGTYQPYGGGPRRLCPYLR